MNNTKKIYFGAAAAIIALAALWYFLGGVEVISVTENMTVAGDYAVPKGTRVEVANGAVITVEGNTTIEGEIAGDAGGVAIVAKGNFVLDEDAKIISEGNAQIVGSESALADTEEKIDSAFNEAGQDLGEGPRVGPFSPGEGGQSSAGSPLLSVSRENRKSSLVLGAAAFLARSANVALANSHDVPDVIVNLSGIIDLSGSDSADEKSRKKIVIVSFPPSAGKVHINLKNLTIIGPQNAPKGADDKGNSCDAKGGDGANGLRLRGHAWGIDINNFKVTLTKGGDGGDAETKVDCDPKGTARGGKGGESGNMKITADYRFTISGLMHIIPGKSGNGGNATAYGKDFGLNGKGGDAYAYGGAGMDNNKNLSVKGTVSGIDNVVIDVLLGGIGGNANANGGMGANGNGCAKKGGDGGKAAAEGGKGGDASLVVLGVSSPVLDIGGDGGDADAKAGAGGNGGDCDAKGAGGNGGNGGSGSAKEGKGGRGDTDGADGGKISNGGDGGNGGSGCPEGKGGKGGAGDIPGKDGANGKNLCVAEQPKTEKKIGDDVIAVPTTKMSFAHVAPGEYSEVYMDITGAPGAPGAQANVKLSGPAVENPNASGTVGSGGKLRLIWRIYQYGSYGASGTVGDSSVSGAVVVN